MSDPDRICSWKSFGLPDWQMMTGRHFHVVLGHLATVGIAGQEGTPGPGVTKLFSWDYRQYSSCCLLC